MSGADAMAMLKALLRGDEYPPPSVEDTPRNRELWDAIAADIEAMPPGVMPDVPGDWAEMPDDGGPPKA